MAETEAVYSEEAHSSRDTALFVSAFFDELYQAGVRDVVVSPGSRSTPLAMIVYKSPLNVYLDVDERGAGFFALGIGKATARPACLICTSGTALANYYPAVMEAESSRVPLIVLSGDRPQHLQQVGAPQTCDQLKAFSSHVKKFWQMPEALATPKRIAYGRQIAREAYAASGAKTVCGGAVHLNFPFDEPLKPDLEAEGLFLLGRQRKVCCDQPLQQGCISQDAIPSVVETSSVLDASTVQKLQRFLQSHRVIALCGEATLGVGVGKATTVSHDEAFDETCVGHADNLDALDLAQTDSSDVPNVAQTDEAVEDNEALRFDAKNKERLALQAFSERYDVPLLADPLSQLRSDTYEAVIENYDNIIARSDCPSFDAIIRFGRWPVSKRLSTALQNVHVPQIVIDPLETRDFTSTTSTVIKMAPLDFVVSMLKLSVQPALSLPKNSFIEEWAALNQKEKERILVAKTNPDDYFEGSYIAALIERLPENSLLFSANSMAIRALDTFYVKQPKKIAVLANRGLNGIDGTISTALGAAQAFDQTVCLTGDLTLLHDINALALQHEMNVREGEGYQRPSIVIVLMNNGGGAIFDMLPQKQGNPYFERMFLTPQNIDFGAAAQAFSVPYSSVSSVEQFERAFDKFAGRPGIHLIDISLPLQGVQERYAPFQ